eukprot:scaffold8447_cov70-Phaeocystis_antarctica.AAC.1
MGSCTQWPPTATHAVGTRESERSEAPFFCACIVLGLAFPWGQDGLAMRRSCATCEPGQDGLAMRRSCATREPPRALRCVHSVATDGNACRRSARVNRSAAQRHFSAPVLCWACLSNGVRNAWP